MTTAFSGYLEVNLLGHTLLGSSFTAPSTVWVALATSIASDCTSIAQFADTEVTTNVGYTRQLANGSWSAPTSGPNWTVVNSSAFTFSAATSAWGTVTHVCLVTSSTHGTGQVLYWGLLDTSRSVQTGDIVQFSAGNLYVRLS